MREHAARLASGRALQRPRRPARCRERASRVVTGLCSASRRRASRTPAGPAPEPAGAWLEPEAPGSRAATPGAFHGAARLAGEAGLAAPAARLPDPSARRRAWWVRLGLAAAKLHCAGGKGAPARCSVQTPCGPLSPRGTRQYLGWLGMVAARGSAALRRPSAQRGSPSLSYQSEHCCARARSTASNADSAATGPPT